ncbi:MAG: (d)CMP kinase [Tannerella sp.]|nr:(d)CMP kinase [Tannerella sp.]
MKKIIVAIDGYSSCGKSTMAKQLAKAVGYTYIDSGAMYRAVTFYVLRHKMLREDNTIDEERLREVIDTLTITFKHDAETGWTETFLNGENVEKEIRRMEVANWVSAIAALDFVRKALVAAQQALGREKGIVMDGRDIGTIVFPQAELKVFVIASAEIRARRRVAEMNANGLDASFEEVLANIQKRDRMDMSRKDGPLRKPDDAVELDNSLMTIPEQQAWLLEQFYRVVKN